MTLTLQDRLDIYRKAKRDYEDQNHPDTKVAGKNLNTMSKLIISFTDQSQSFCNGVEFGRLLERMESGKDPVMNNGLPVRIENKDVINQACKAYGYIPMWGHDEQFGWIELIAIRKTTSDN